MTDCRRLYEWCRSDIKDSCIVNSNGEELSSNSKTLCSNNTMWKSIPTGLYSDGGKLFSKGTRCNGTSQHQINPWYKFYDGEPGNGLKQNCDDFSDRIHTAEAPCPNQTHFLMIHRNLWCNNSLATDYRICTNTSSWSPPAHMLAKLDDPHFCNESCQAPGPGCIACTNKDYFRCRNSRLCIHPRLRCDGHPQCPEYDDEDYHMCNKTYIENGQVAPFATFRCYSKIYPRIETIATRCNNVNECHNDLDEVDCSKNDNTKSILVAAVCLSLGIFLGMKLPQVVRFIKLDKQIAIEETEEDKQNFDRIIQNLRENPENKIACQNINVFLLHILNTKKTSVVKKTYVKFYDSLVEIYENDLSKMFVFLKAHIDPAVTTDIVEHRYRGLKTKIINFLEMKVIRYKMITHCTNKVTEKTVLRLTFSSLTCLVGLLSHILDTIKDTLLAMTLLNIIGGISSIIEFPTYFTTAVVLSLMGTIIVPILLSSAHLAITQPFLVFNSARLRAWRWGRVVAGLGCLILSPLNTVVLKTRYEMTKQEAIKAARDQGDNTIALYEECDKIQAHILEHVQNEIGILIPKL